jgi:hypothetical protein
VAIDLRIDEHSRPQPGTAAAAQAQAERQQRHAWGGLDQHRPIGLHVVLPAGKVIASYNCRYVAAGEKDVGHMVRFLEEALARAGPVTERRVAHKQLHPDRGLGVRADGSIRLAVTARSLSNGKPANHRPVFESAYLTVEQVKTLAPPQAKVGVRYTVAEDSVRQFTTALTDDGDDVFTIRPREATAGCLQAEVMEVTPSQIHIRLTGHLAGKRVSSERTVAAEASVHGLIIFDRKGELQRALIVTDGHYRSPWARAPHSVSGLVEWRAAPGQ